MFGGMGKSEPGDPAPPADASKSSSFAKMMGDVKGMVNNAVAKTSGKSEPLLPSGGDQGHQTKSRTSQYVESLAQLSDSRYPQLAGCLRATAPVLEIALQAFAWMCVGYYKLGVKIYGVYKILPANELQMVIGILLCFFGGTYVTLIAAVEAFRTMGGQALYADLEYVWEQAQIVKEHQDRDDLLDENNDGIPDTQQIETQEFTTRKLKVGMKAVKDPDKLESAVGNLWAACLAVLATLKMQFAQTVAYALGISEQVKLPLMKYAAPSLELALGPELSHWTETIIDSSLKVVCILLIWYMQKLRSAFYSGLRGGRMFGEAFIKFCEKRGWIDNFPDSLVKKPFNPDESMLDEAIGYSLGAIGFYWQVTSLFLLPFPVNWLLWPLTILEAFLEVQVTWH